MQFMLMSSLSTVDMAPNKICLTGDLSTLCTQYVQHLCSLLSKKWLQGSRLICSASMWGCSHIDSSRRKNSDGPASTVKWGHWLVDSPVNHPTFPTEVCWATQQISTYSLLIHSPPYCFLRRATYHLRTFSMAARTFLMSSLARLRVSARPDLPDILMLLWFIYRCIWKLQDQAPVLLYSGNLARLPNVFFFF